MKLFNELCAKVATVSDKIRYKPSVGLEIHAQICSKSKLFSTAAFDDSVHVNACVELFDIAIPGTLPVLNRNCVLKGLQAGILLNCTIPQRCRFERKHYFYADMPLGYQITQQRYPIAHTGHFDYFVHSTDQHFCWYRKNLKISRIQLEIDSAKTIHDLANNRSLIDFNRAGVPLLEIVTEPQLSSALEAICFVEQLRILFALNGICNGEMHKGQLRVDANISLAHHNSSELGVRTEVKNMNSLKSVYSAINYEISRQYEILKGGGEVLNETRTVDHKGHTVPMREKEIETDYRFMPEPNLPTVRINAELLAKANENLKRTPKYLQFIENFGFDPNSALHLTKEESLSNFIEQIFQENSGLGDIKFLLEWLKELKRICGRFDKPYPPCRENFAEIFANLLRLNNEHRLTRLTTIDLLKRYVNDESLSLTPLEVAEKENLWQINDTNEICGIVEQVFDKCKEGICKATNKTKTIHKLRNAIIDASNKRVEVERAADAAMERLTNYQQQQQQQIRSATSATSSSSS